MHIAWGTYNQKIPLLITYGGGIRHRIRKAYAIVWKTGWFGIVLTEPSYRGTKNAKER